MIKNFQNFLNESEWYATFKAQGEILDRKDDVSTEELQKIASYFSEIFGMENVKVGEIEKLPAKVDKNTNVAVKVYGVRGDRKGPEKESFYYFWRPSSDTEAADLEASWIGKITYTKDGEHFPTHMGQFMSPLQFLECVEMHYRYSHAWIEPVSNAHIEKFNQEMNDLLQGRRKTWHTSKKFGI